MFFENLLDLLKAREPGIWVTTTEEKELIVTLKNVIDKVSEFDCIYTWSISEGVQKLDSNGETLLYTKVPGGDGLLGLNKMFTKLNDIDNMENPIFILKDYHQQLNNANAIRMVRDLKESPINKYIPLIITSPTKDIPVEFQGLFKLMEYEMPNEESIFNLLKHWCFSKKLTLKSKDMQEISKRLLGFTKSEIIKMLNLSYVKYDNIDIDIINQKKIEMINDSGVLTYKIPQADIKNIGGNKNFKEWLEVVKECMSEEALEYGVPSPKGYLALGIPGTSKSYMAEAIAHDFNVPFIKLDMSKILSRFVGSSEQNIDKAIRTVQGCSPCVLLIDEVEKALGGFKGSQSGSDAGALARIYAKILEFLVDSKDVFVVMTSNDVSQLPPELTRAGRLDAIWYFSLPTEEERKEILKIHLNKHNKKVSLDVIDDVLKELDKYTGAEIELVVKSALRRAYLEKVKTGEDKGITYEILSKACKDVVPIAISSREQITSLERWAHGRALFANDNANEKIQSNKIASIPKISSLKPR